MCLLNQSKDLKLIPLRNQQEESQMQILEMLTNEMVIRKKGMKRNMIRLSILKKNKIKQRVPIMTPFFKNRSKK